MIDVHTLYLVGLISQATFALTLALLAWIDRRTKGTAWLAGACALQFAWMSSRSVSEGRVNGVSEALSACLLVLLFYSIFVGFRWFVKQQGIESRKEKLAATGAMVAVLAVALASPLLAVVLGRCIALAIGVKTVAMLWTPQAAGMRNTSRVSAVLLTLTMTIIASNVIAGLPMESATVIGTEPSVNMFLRSVTIALVIAMSFSFVALFVSETNRRLQEDSRTDSLTTLRNRRSMEEVALREVRRATQRKMPLALLMMDLDHFKNLNDTWGHALGDRALRAVGSVLQNAVGPRDLTARMGGEEFAVLLPGRDMETAAEVAERLRATIAELRLHEAENSASMTVSIGVSVLRDGEDDWTEMLCRADDALYRAKRDGRNRVAICTVGPSEMSGDRIPGKRAWRSRYSLPKQML